MTINHYDGLRSKVKRANERIESAQRRVGSFYETHPYEVFRDIDLTGQRESLKVRLHAIPDDEISLDVAEATYHLRSALDLLVCALALTNGAANTSGTYFPFTGDENEFKSSQSQGKIKKLHPDAIQMICDLKPYRGGNDLLWGLGKLANIDKHIQLIAIGNSRIGMQYNFVAHFQAGDVIRPPDTNWLPLDKEITLLTYPAGRQLQGDVKIATDVAFGNIEVFEGEPLIAVMNQLSDLVGRIIGIFEARFPA